METSFKKDLPDVTALESGLEGSLGFDKGQRKNKDNLNFWRFLFLVKLYNFWIQRKRNQPGSK